MSPFRFTTLKLWGCLSLLVAIQAPAAFGAAQVLERHTLQNSKIKIQFIKAKKSPAAGDALLAMKQIVDLATGTRFDTTLSPLWSVELRSATDPGTYVPMRIPQDPIDSVFLPLADTQIVEEKASSFRLLWHSVPVPGGSQRLEMVATVTLRADSKSEWNISATISDGPYGVYAVRFPYVAMDVIGADGTTDQLLTPFSGGMRLPRPTVNHNTFPERGSPEGSTLDALFTYPGQMFTQFMAYYDAALAGLYMQTEDVNGYTKNLYFDNAPARLKPAKNLLYLYFTHFNSTPSVGSGSTAGDRSLAFEALDVKAKFGYSTVLTTFTGDWLDASEIYRSWVTSASAPFLADGELASRTDFAATLKQTAYAFRYQLPLSPLDIDAQGENDKVQRLLQYYETVRERFDPDRRNDFLPIAIAARYQYDPATMEPILGSGDDFAEPLRPGVPDWLYLVREPRPSQLRVRQIALNRDTSGIDVNGANTADVLQKGVMRTSTWNPTFADSHTYRTCLGSAWLLNRRADIVMQTIADSVVAGTPGFTMAGLSGDGNYAYGCYASGVDNPSDVDPAAHNHPVGGGCYLTNGWHVLANQLKGRAQAQFGITLMLLGMEHEPETAISDYILTGRSFPEPYDNSEAGIGRTVRNSIPIPLFKYLYHDYNLWPGKVPPFADVVNTYVDSSHPLSDLMLIRYRIAQLAMMGRLLMIQVSQEPDFVQYEGIPDSIPNELQDEHLYFAAMATLRAAIPEFLIFGAGLRDPVITPAAPDDSITIRTIWNGIENQNVVPRIVGSAWGDANYFGHPGVVLTNFTPQAAAATFSFRPAEYGLAPGLNYKIQTRSVGTDWHDTAMTLNGSDAMFVSSTIAVPPFEDDSDEPWRIFRFIAAGSAPKR